MNVRSKWQCVSVRKYQSSTWTDGKMEYGFAYEYEFNVVTTGSEENKQFFASTPYGNLKIGAVRDDLYEPGKSYYFDSVPAEA